MMSIIKKFAAILIIITSFYFLIGSFINIPSNVEYLEARLDTGSSDVFDYIKDIYNVVAWIIFRPLSYFSFIILGLVLLFEKK
tara:strand:- start:778 stop:1026 length:249 start_codon:yes stop_codon:yes gene_type:complete